MGRSTVPAHEQDRRVYPEQNGAVMTRKNEVKKDALNAFLETIKLTIKDFQRKSKNICSGAEHQMLGGRAYTCSAPQVKGQNIHRV